MVLWQEANALLPVAKQPFGSSRVPPTAIGCTANNDVSPRHPTSIAPSFRLADMVIRPESHRAKGRHQLQKYEKN